jgi:site-specific DNA recombinase
MTYSGSNQPAVLVTTEGSVLTRRYFAIYTRFSSDMQRDSSTVDQIAQCTRFGEGKGFELELQAIFSDEAVSGTSMSGRARLKALKAAVKSGKFKFTVLIIADSSRLARDVGDSAELRKFFAYYGITVYEASTGISSTDSGYLLNYTIQSFISEDYSRALGDKVSRGQRGRVEAGYLPSGKCFGYDNVPIEDPTRTGEYGRLKVIGVKQVINEAKAALIRRIFRMHADGVGGYGGIARILNAEGVAAPGKGRKDLNGWQHAAIRTILNNKRYLGEVTYGRTVTVRDPETGQKGHRKVDGDPVTYHNQELRIISDDLWNAVRQRNARTNEKYGTAKRGGLGRTPAARRYIFSGLLRCGQCGGSLVMRGAAKGGYSCSSSKRGLGCSNMLYIRREELESQLLEAIGTQLAEAMNPELLRSEIRDAFRAMELSQETESGEREQLRAGLEKDLASAQAGIENLCNAVMSCGLSASLRDRLASEETRKQLIMQQLAATEPPEHPPISAEDVIDLIEREGVNLAEVLRADPIRTREELHKRIDTLTLTPTTFFGQAAYEVTGEIGVWIPEETVLLCNSLPSTTQQHAIHLSKVVLRDGVRLRKNYLPPVQNLAGLPIAA